MEIDRAAREVSRHSAGHRGLVAVPDLVRDVTRYLQGWGQYFADGYPRRMYNRAASFVLLRLVRPCNVGVSVPSAPGQ